MIAYWLNIMKLGTIYVIKFLSMLVNDGKYIKAKVREFISVIKTNFCCDKIPKKGKHHTCIACITNDSVMKIERKNCPQVCLEECKYEIKNIKVSEFIDTKLESNSCSDSE